MRLPARAGKEQMVAWGEADGKQVSVKSRSDAGATA